MNEEQMENEIKAKRMEMQNSGYVHRRDLRKYIHRLEVELLTYRKYQRGDNKCQRLQRAILQ